MQPKTQRSKDIQTVNRVVKTLRPYLCFEDEITVFVTERIKKQISEVKDKGLWLTANSFYHFTLGDVEKGIDYAEKSLSFMPSDIVTWRHYTLGMFWRCGAVGALNVAKRAVEATHSPLIAHDAYFYASAVADYQYFLDMHKFLIKTKTYDDLIEEEQKVSMQRSFEFASISDQYKKSEIIKNISVLMYEKLSLEQKLETTNRLVDLTDDDGEPELLFELYVNNASAESCAAMNIELVTERVNSGLNDWSVGAVFLGYIRKDGE